MAEPNQSEPVPGSRWTIPEDVKASLRERRLLPALWYVGPLEPEPAFDEERPVSPPANSPQTRPALDEERP